MRPTGERELWEAMRRYYQDRAPFHDMLMSYTTNEAMEELLSPIVSVVAEEVRGRDVLEVACGTGNWTQVLARRARSVVATDAHEAYLELARAKRYGGGDVTFLKADALDLSPVERCFQVAFSADWWSHVPLQALPRFLDSLRDRLVPGGTVVVVEMLRTDPLMREFVRRDGDGNEVFTRTLPTGLAYEVVKNFPTEEELRASLEGHATMVDYRAFEDLGRWMLLYTSR